MIHFGLISPLATTALAATHTSLQSDFAWASRAVQPLTNVSMQDQLHLYAYHKQATVGDVRGARPSSLLNAGERAKYDAWAELKGMSAEDAMQNYVSLVRSLVDAR